MFEKESSKENKEQTKNVKKQHYYMKDCARQNLKQERCSVTGDVNLFLFIGTLMCILYTIIEPIMLPINSLYYKIRDNKYY